MSIIQQKSCLVLILLCLHSLGWGQTISEVDVIDFSVNPGGRIDEIGLPPTKVEGTGYLNEEWGYGYLKLYSLDTIENVLVRFDVFNQYVEVSRDKVKTRIAHVPIVESFSYGDKIFVNPKVLEIANGPKLDGMFEVLYNQGGNYLLRHYEVSKKQSTYVPAFDVGNRNEELIMKDRDYLVSSNTLYELPSSKSGFSKFVEGQFSVQLKKKLNPKRTEEMTEFINDYLVE